MTAAWLATLALLAFSYGLGAASVKVWQLYRGWIRGAPWAATLIYYAAFVHFPPPAVMAVKADEAYAPDQAFRTIAGAVAFGLSLLLIARRAERKP